MPQTRLGRLFTFGCSFTKYTYPTWADILGKSWSYHENWGKPGSGNHFIFHSLVECLHRNRITKDDHVMIMWSALTRTDYYQFGEWRVCSLGFPGENLAANCPDGYEIQNYSLMHAAHEILDKHQIPYNSMSWVEHNKDSVAGMFYKKTLDKIQPISFGMNKLFYNPINSLFFKTRAAQLYKDLAGPDWPSLESIMSGKFYARDTIIEDEVNEFVNLYKKDYALELVSKERDQHPTPVAHLAIVKKYFPDIEVSDQTENWVNEINAKLLDGEFFVFDSVSPAHRL